MRHASLIEVLLLTTLSRYPVQLPEGFAAAKTEAAQRDPNASHENPSNGELILGHVSVLNTFLLSEDQKHIITADRDEHIRISRFPRGYNIEAYCFGHKTYATYPGPVPKAHDTIASYQLCTFRHRSRIG